MPGKRKIKDWIRAKSVLGKGQEDKSIFACKSTVQIKDGIRAIYVNEKNTNKGLDKSQC